MLTPVVLKQTHVIDISESVPLLVAKYLAHVEEITSVMGTTAFILQPTRIVILVLKSKQLAMTRIPTATTFHLCREVQAHIDWLMDKYDDKFFIDLEFVKNQYRWFDGVPVSVDHVSVDNVSEGPRFLFDPTNGEIESTDCSVTQSELPCQKSYSMFWFH